MCAHIVILLIIIYIKFSQVTNLTKFHYYIASCIYILEERVIEDKRIVLCVHFVSPR